MNDERDERAMVDLEIGEPPQGVEAEPVMPESERELADVFKVEQQQAGDKQGGDRPPESEAGKTKDAAPYGAERAPDVKPTADAEHDDIDKIDKPTPDDWRRFRDAYKERKRELRELREAKPAPRSERGDGPVAADGDGRSRAPERTDIDPGEVFKVLAEVASGDNEKVSRDKVEEFIAGNLSPEQVADVVFKARKGAFGDRSGEILALAQEQLPLVQAVSGRAARQRAEESDRARIREESLAELLKEYPEARDENSQHYRDVQAAVAELQQFTHPSVMSLPNSPGIVQRYMRMQRDVAQAAAVREENSRLKAEVDTLRKQLGRPAAPPAGGGRTREGEETADQWLEKQLRQ